MADGNIIRPDWPLRVVEQSPAGRHDFPQDDEPGAVTVTGGLDGPRVWIRGKVWLECKSITAAARIASALMTLDAYGLLDCVQSPREAVRHMLNRCPEVKS